MVCEKRARLALESAILDLEQGQESRALGVLEPLAKDLASHGRTRVAGEAWLAAAGSRWRWPVAGRSGT